MKEVVGNLELGSGYRLCGQRQDSGDKLYSQEPSRAVSLCGVLLLSQSEAIIIIGVAANGPPESSRAAAVCVVASNRQGCTPYPRGCSAVCKGGCKAASDVGRYLALLLWDVVELSMRLKQDEACSWCEYGMLLGKAEVRTCPAHAALAFMHAGVCMYVCACASEGS